MPDINTLSLEETMKEDGDNFSPAGPDDFPVTFHQQSSAAVSLQNSYILHLAKCDETLCAVMDSGECVLFKIDTLVKTNSIKPHDRAVTGVANTPGDSNQLVTCSLDQTVKVWDLRQPVSSPVHTLRDNSKHNSGPPSNPGKPFISVAVNSAGLVAAGTEQVGLDAYILFWDLRSGGKLLGGYWDAHSDDITTLDFHPESKDFMSSGSTDGLVNVFDLSQSDEDSALVTSSNTEDSVQKTVWLKKKSSESDRCIAVHTHTEGLQLWNTDDSTPIKKFDRSDICQSIRRSSSEYTFIAGIHPRQTGDDGLYIVAGSSCLTNPCTRISLLEDDELRPFAICSGCGTGGGVIRSTLFIEEQLVTGGEDGVVRLWKVGELQSDDSSGKMINKTSRRDKPY